MTTEQQKSLEQTSELNNSTDVLPSIKTTTKKPKWLFLICAIALFAGGIILWRLVSNSQQSSEEVTENIEQARLTVKTVTANLELSLTNSYFFPCGNWDYCSYWNCR